MVPLHSDRPIETVEFNPRPTVAPHNQRLFTRKVGPTFRKSRVMPLKMRHQHACEKSQPPFLGSILRDGLENLLRQWGYETAAASSGEKALEVAERQVWRFGGLVTDQRLGGGLTGVEMARATTGKSGRSIPALILTRDAAKEGIAEIAGSGFAMLHKPISADILRRRLAELMGG